MAEPIIVERTFNATPASVWRALTEKDEMKKWYFDVSAFKPEIGFEFSFTGGTDEHQYLHLCKIAEAEPLRKLKHSWRYEGYEGNTFVTWEIIPEEDHQTKVRLTHEDLETFPQSNPDFDRKNFVAGWNSIVNESLKNYLEK